VGGDGQEGQDDKGGTERSCLIINIMKMMLIMKRTNRLFSQGADVSLTCKLQIIF